MAIWSTPDADWVPTHVTHTASTGWLDIYPLHVLSEEQLQKLFRHAGRDAQARRMLDIGAGVGGVTKSVEKMLSCEVVCTEMSPAMAARLRDRQGFSAVWEEDVSDTWRQRLDAGQGNFDMIMMLNVLDRTSAPHELLRAARELLSPGGVALICSPLPFKPVYYAEVRCVVLGGFPGDTTKVHLNYHRASTSSRRPSSGRSTTSWPSAAAATS